MFPTAMHKCPHHSPLLPITPLLTHTADVSLGMRTLTIVLSHHDFDGVSLITNSVEHLLMLISIPPAYLENSVFKMLAQF